MKKENSIVLFHQKKVRRHWDEEQNLFLKVKRLPGSDWENVF